MCGTGLESLEALSEQNLLGRSQSGRFFMLETIREFAAERLGDAPELRRSHLQHYLEVGLSAGLTDDRWVRCDTS